MSIKSAFKKACKSEQGFASFEFAWSSVLFVTIIVVLFQFFGMFQRSDDTLLKARYSAFSAVGKVPLSSTLSDRPGLVYEGDLWKTGGCLSGCKEHLAVSDHKAKLPLVNATWRPRQSVFIILEDPE